MIYRSNLVKLPFPENFFTLWLPAQKFFAPVPRKTVNDHDLLSLAAAIAQMSFMSDERPHVPVPQTEVRTKKIQVFGEPIYIVGPSVTLATLAPDVVRDEQGELTPAIRVNDRRYRLPETFSSSHVISCYYTFEGIDVISAGKIQYFNREVTPTWKFRHVTNQSAVLAVFVGIIGIHRNELGFGGLAIEQ